MTETDVPRGPLSARPAADQVRVGQAYDDENGDRWRSDGRQWWLANAERDPYRLVYGEDLEQGMHVRRVAEIPAQVAPGVSFVHQQLHVPEWVILADIRAAGDILACIGVRPNGEQVPLYFGRVELVQAKTEQP